MSDSNVRLEPLLSAANAASARARTAWLAHIALGAYLFIVVGGTTQRDLLLGASVKLPILQVDLPIVGFYVVAPLVFWLMHLNLLIDLHLLTGKLKQFISALAFSSARIEAEHVRGRLDLFVFSQGLAAGGHSVAARVLMWLMVRATTVVGPLLLLLAIQLRFLPYHDPWITNWHRIVILADLGLLAAVWPGWRLVGEAEPLRPFGFDLRRLAPWGTYAWMGLTWLTVGALVLFSVSVATIPDEWIERHVTSGSPPLQRLTQRLLEPAPDEVRGAPGGLFARNLVVSDQALSIWDANRKEWQGPNLRGRDLRYGIFSRANLRGADLTGADLRRANLFEARLARAELACALRTSSDGRIVSECVDLRGAKLLGADLMESNLSGAHLEGASLVETRLEGARLTGAHLEGAILFGAHLEGTDLVEAQLEGAQLVAARMDGADLIGASLRGADANDSTVWRAEFSDPNRSPREARKLEGFDVSKLSIRCIDPLRWEQLRDRLDTGLKSDEGRTSARTRFQGLSKPWNDCNTVPEPLRELKRPDVLELARILADLACGAPSAPYIARGLIVRGRWPEPNFSLATFGLRIATLQRQQKCPGTVGLTVEELELLEHWGSTGHP